MVRQIIAIVACWSIVSTCYGELQCGASVVDVTPRHLPVIRNGGFLEAQDDKVLDPLHARCLVLDDGTGKTAIIVVDSCMIPTTLCDEAKKLVTDATSISHDRIMISATHTHTAPSVMRFCLGSRIDQRYAEFLPGKIAEAVVLANSNLQPAKVAATQIDASRFTKCRRFITRSDKLQQDPFGELTIHANMHPGHQNPDFIGPSGPIDPWLSLLMVADLQGRPIAALGNLSMHYFGGHAGVSSDYYGHYCAELAKRINTDRAKDQPKFVGIMSQGTSGDLWWGDYSIPQSEKPFRDYKQFAAELAELTKQAIDQLDYQEGVPVRIAEKRMTVDRRIPNEERLAWAQRMNKLRGDRLPKDRPEVYALQLQYLHDNPTDEVVLQAIRVGDLGITCIPNEVYALTGLKLKRRSPFKTTMNISLANGACGYIPPPEQHALGGYTSWPARTAGPEVAAEPRIVEALLELLEQVADKPRKAYIEAETDFSRYVTRKSKPYAFWRFAEMEQSDGRDASGNNRTIRHNGHVAYHLPGRVGGGFGTANESHAIQLADGKLVVDNLDLGESYSVQFSFYLGTTTDFREQTATMITRGSDTLAITGRNSESPGHLAFGDAVGKTKLETKRWHQCVFVRNGDFVQVFLDGRRDPEISAKVGRTAETDATKTMMLGGDPKNTANFEGKFDEVSVYDRALTKQEIDGLFTAAGLEVATGESSKLDSAPLDPKTSMQHIHVRDGFRIELVAAEPMVIDPVAIDWAKDGKLWFVEMADYPMGIDGQGKPGGRIRVLEDTNDDGNYDRSTLFLDNISFPNGVMAWRDGVLVTAAPEIFFAADTDGDGKADRRDTLLSGFMTGNQQLRVNGLRWGLDGMVHCASGAHHAGFGSDNSIFSAKLGKSIRLGSRDFCFHPETGALNPQSGPSQYGRVRDDFGDWFGVQNSQPLWHYVLRDQYARRNTDVPSMDPRKQVRVPRMPEVYSAKPPQRRFHGFDHAGHYTSACGISIYRDELLFPREEIHAFTCEPFHNLVQHHQLESDGTSFRGERADDGPIDFFASSDRWTRPVMSRTGPDGALWIVDMYRYMIEHPQWLPKEGQDALRPGFRSGDQLGRIYRIVPDQTPTRPVPKLKNAKPEELAALLSHPNGPVRDIAHRELIATDQPNVSELVRNIAQSTDSAEGRIQALATLAGLDAIEADLVRTASKDDHPAVRRFAIRLAELLPPNQLDSSDVIALVDDADAKVRLQLAASLGTWPTQAAGEALIKLATMPGNDAYTDAAIISSIPTHYETLCHSAMQVATARPSQKTKLLDAMLLVGDSRPAQLAKLLEQLLDKSTDPELRFQTIARWLDRLADRKQSFASLCENNASLEKVSGSLSRLIAEAKRVAVDSSQGAKLRSSAIGFFGQESEKYKSDILTLRQLIATTEPEAIQKAAMSRLRRIPTAEAAKVMLENWPSYLPQRRELVTTALLSRTDWSLRLLDAIDDGTVQIHDLSLAQQQSLRNTRDTPVAARASEVFGALHRGSADELVAHYSEKLLVGNSSDGQVVFDANCKACHTLDRTKNPVGPDLRSLTNRSRTALLTAVLDPSQSIDPKYANYSMVLLNGEVLSGVILDESESSLTLGDSNGKRRQVLRNSIELVKRARKSLMPEGFETKITPAQMSDLIAYLREL